MSLKIHHLTQKVRFTHPDDSLTHTGLVVGVDRHRDGYTLEIVYREETHVSDMDGDIETIALDDEHVQRGWMG